MKIKEGFELRTICRENIIISHGISNINFTKVISLNESAALVWRGVEGKDFTVNDMVKILTDEYEVDEATARADSEQLVKDWKEVGFIDE